MGGVDPAHGTVPSVLRRSAAAERGNADIDRRTWVAVALGSVLCGCGGGSAGDGSETGTSPAGPLARVQVLSGTDQQAVVGQPLPQALTVRLLDAAGRPVPGHSISFVVVSGGGQVFAGHATSDANGQASERWTLGTATGVQRLEVRSVLADGSAQVWTTFEATGLAGDPSVFRVLESGGGAAQLQPLPLPTLVQIVDAWGNPCPGVIVRFEASDGGSAFPASVTSDTSGRAATQWTLGALQGWQFLDLSAGGARGRLESYAGAAPPGTPARLVKLAGDEQRTPQHTRMGVLVQVLDALDHPVPEARVRFDVETLSAYFAPRVVVTDAQGRAAWEDYVHSDGAQVVVASMEGDALTPAARFTMHVTPSGALYDGHYDFVATLAGVPPNSHFPTVFDRILRDSRWPEYDLLLDPSTGRAPSISIRLSLDLRYEMQGQFTIDASGHARGEGTLFSTFAGKPSDVTGSWQAARR